MKHKKVTPDRKKLLPKAQPAITAAILLTLLVIPNYTVIGQQTRSARKIRVHRGAKKKMVNQPESIGMATMSEDKTIILDLRAEGKKGEIGTGRATYPLSDPQYNDILKHLGGLKIGEKKPVPPWKNN